jgi:hypothetical protein
MTLINEALRRTSALEVSDLQRHARAMPVYLFERACHESRAINDQARAARILDALVTCNLPLQLWRDSDLYYPIFTLFECKEDAAASDRLLRRLEIQLGLRPIGDLRALPPATYRVLPVTGSAWKWDGEDLGRVAGAFTAIPQCPAIVYPPRAHLFQDVLPAERYPLPADPDLDEARLLRQLGAACDLLARLDPELWQDFRDLITTIVLVPSGAPSVTAPFDALHQTFSYNLRLRYFGGIFVSATHLDTFAVVEALAHEYLHQRLWHWWELEHPDGLPSPHTTIVSPVTGVVRPAYVMVQGLMIYAAVFGLHRAALTGGVSTPATGWLRARVSQLEETIPRLLDALTPVVAPASTVDRLVDVAARHFRSHCTSGSTREVVMHSEPEGCGILLHQRPWLAELTRFDDPRALLSLETWLTTKDEAITDDVLADATVTLDGKNLIFLKALVDGRPEIINIELEEGQFVTRAELAAASNTICVHTSNDPNSGFNLRDEVKDVKILAVIRNWTLRSHTDPDRIAVKATRTA